MFSLSAAIQTTIYFQFHLIAWIQGKKKGNNGTIIAKVPSHELHSHPPSHNYFNFLRFFGPIAHFGYHIRLIYYAFCFVLSDDFCERCARAPAKNIQSTAAVSICMSISFFHLFKIQLMVSLLLYCFYSPSHLPTINILLVLLLLLLLLLLSLLCTLNWLFTVLTMHESDCRTHYFCTYTHFSMCFSVFSCIFRMIVVVVRYRCTIDYSVCISVYGVQWIYAVI